MVGEEAAAAEKFHAGWRCDRFSPIPPSSKPSVVVLPCSVVEAMDPSPCSISSHLHIGVGVLWPTQVSGKGQSCVLEYRTRGLVHPMAFALFSVLSVDLCLNVALLDQSM
ncbi:hypothetical protein CEXT_583641 [Caerostris extrusa]|uniref:Uncharacterized protein n=1 Tax=Caerostris extrusa TaxID=172846 RepID=A0AAV4XQZ7_CAEEX|nr:hypothetical protein CEXT_583641 [Caerostris extrusa]